ncbi:hypothetical protein DSO57_1015524 [Entomophthora muscae]|uniref:Uncharacterized protein n=1 Tax=Entomophthora muscae TaxID=34485 RepID=A0ACC2RJT5_9FUNG|nr:hypothetical protein DSO57_1015524 [Entomophthora muscae]
MKCSELISVLIVGLIRPVYAKPGKNAYKLHPACFGDLDVSFKNDQSYNDYMFAWNERLGNVAAGAVVRPKSEAQVIQAVRCASNSTTISVRSGGHSYEGYWRGNKNGLVVDLRKMNNIVIDKGKKQVTVQAGALLGKVIAALWKEDKGVLPHGLQPTIGMGGMTLGGGFGLLSRNYGLLVDRVVSLRMVDANGRVMTVDEKRNSKLFFALRGAGGGNFGVVTEFTYSYIKHSQDFTVARYNWITGKNNFTKIVKAVMDYYDSKPPNGAGHYLNLSPGGSVELGITYSDNYKDHAGHIKKLEKILKKWDKKDVQRKDWINAYLFFAGYAGQPDKGTAVTLYNAKPLSFKFFYKAKSGFLKERLNNATINKLKDILVKPGDGLFVLIDLWGGVIPGRKGTAFDNRDKYALVQIGQTDANAGELLKKTYAAFQSSFVGAYQNYIDAEEPDFKKVYYPKSLMQLQKIKAEYDPKDVFHFSKSIPVAS